MKTLAHYCSTGAFLLKLNVQRQLEYPSFLLGWVLSNALQFLTGAGTLYVIVYRFENLGGWSFGELAFMYGLGIISHGISVILFVQTWYTDWLVINGEFDRMLLRPMNVFFQFLFYNFNLIGITDLIPGIIIFVYGAAAVGFRMNPVNMLWLLAVLTGAVLIRGAIYTLAGTVSFRTKRSTSLVEISLSLFSKAMMYPLTIYPMAVQLVFTVLLPLGFLCFYPAGGLLGKDVGIPLPGSFALWTLGVGVALYALSQRLFSRGLRRYESSGS